ncbi:hypothetical protein HK096_007131 [Nowakowskiella sp. JEL0078]|nr:hypothetical protein HK096_007131 [Nowakowskiella sp. JEL0078]
MGSSSKNLEAINEENLQNSLHSPVSEDLWTLAAAVASTSGSGFSGDVNLPISMDIEQIKLLDNFLSQFAIQYLKSQGKQSNKEHDLSQYPDYNCRTYDGSINRLKTNDFEEWKSKNQTLNGSISNFTASPSNSIFYDLDVSQPDQTDAQLVALSLLTTESIQFDDSKSSEMKSIPIHVPFDVSKTEKRKIRENTRNLVCYNCRTDKTPLWRRTSDRQHSLCNACDLLIFNLNPGLYFKQYQCHRPANIRQKISTEDTSQEQKRSFLSHEERSERKSPKRNLNDQEISLINQTSKKLRPNEEFFSKKIEESGLDNLSIQEVAILETRERPLLERIVDLPNASFQDRIIGMHRKQLESLLFDLETKSQFLRDILEN